MKDGNSFRVNEITAATQFLIVQSTKALLFVVPVPGFMPNVCRKKKVSKYVDDVHLSRRH